MMATVQVEKKTHVHKWEPHKIGFGDGMATENPYFVVRFSCTAEDIDCHELMYEYLEAWDFED